MGKLTLIVTVMVVSGILKQTVHTINQVTWKFPTRPWLDTQQAASNKNGEYDSTDTEAIQRDSTPFSDSNNYVSEVPGSSIFGVMKQACVHHAVLVEFKKNDETKLANGRMRWEWYIPDDFDRSRS